MKLKYLFILFTLLIIPNSLFSQTKTPFLINDELFELPGKWEMLGKVEKSGQYGFNNKKNKLTLLISVRKTEKFEFYSKDLSELDFLNKFYTWESEHWLKDDKKIEVEKIELNETEKYIIWRLKIIDQNIESFILSGVRNSRLIGISLSDNNKKEPKSRSEKTEFLKDLYFKK
ncbi:hypothetical protein EQG63_09340 [Flavobacterium amnicola]|uniref:Uncharacterized protein n=1 Tax=Flavobacterium amnicola TaxID=2506422 RepID=A0A4Q1K195_9FLAO|nr:hypothetical protein [Flavobacterium amnicola]RXR17684.1 hypothetical protein EQG63_09340 [Flavobacterium amnicola]